MNENSPEAEGSYKHNMVERIGQKKSDEEVKFENQSRKVTKT